MLQTLHIENIAAIEKADIDFRVGLNVLTGETGAGKSIIIDSLEAALGWRTSKELVRTGADNALVTAVFSADGATAWCEENDIDVSDGELVLTRKIGADGRTSCRVNGIPLSAAQTRALSLNLIDIHGQGEGQKLLSEKYHLNYLDSFAYLENDLSEYKKLYSSYIETKKELENLEADSGEKERRIDMLRFQVAEIERANIRVGEYDELIARRDLLKNSGKLTEAINNAFYAMFGGDRNSGAIDCIASAESVLSKESRISKQIEDISARLTELRYSAEDIAEEIRDVRDSLDFSPEELDEIESRVDALRRILKKYGGTEENVMSFLEESRTELENIENSDEMIEKLKKSLAQKEIAARKAGELLSEKRKIAANDLSSKIENQLHDLSMAGSVFIVDVNNTGSLSSNGLDTVRFRMSANLGEAPEAVNKVASGGELSRIMLAMKTVLAENDSVPVMVFDEIDTGISGIAAQRVASKLAIVSRAKQVICVTHLPQISVMADTQLSVEKQQKDGRTYTQVVELDDKGREREIARLMGGDIISDITLAGASEQLNAAKKFKEGLTQR